MIRYLLIYLGAHYEEIKYTSHEMWFEKDKINLGLDLPNLPYLIDGNFKLTETGAIERYLINVFGKKEELIGKTPEACGT